MMSTVGLAKALLYLTDGKADYETIKVPVADLRVLANTAIDHADLKSALEEGNASDGYHTHNELYEYRTLFHAHAALAWSLGGVKVTKSWRHSDGELCFGGGWFIVTAQLHDGQVSNHYPEKDWELFHVPEVERPAPWDGHTPQEAAERLRAALIGETDD